jgi:hypothetical protein
MSLKFRENKPTLLFRDLIMRDDAYGMFEIFGNISVNTRYKNILQNIYQCSQLRLNCYRGKRRSFFFVLWKSY